MGTRNMGARNMGAGKNGWGTGRVFPQEVERHLFPRPRDPCSEWSAGREEGGGAREKFRSGEKKLKPKKEHETNQNFHIEVCEENLAPQGHSWKKCFCLREPVF